MAVQARGEALGPPLPSHLGHPDVALRCRPGDAEALGRLDGLHHAADVYPPGRRRPEGGYEAPQPAGQALEPNTSTGGPLLGIRPGGGSLLSRGGHADWIPGSPSTVQCRLRCRLRHPEAGHHPTTWTMALRHAADGIGMQNTLRIFSKDVSNFWTMVYALNSSR